MSDQRDGGIAWTDQTWNPIRGCSRVSEGCRNCYAERVAGRYARPRMPYHGLVTKNAATGAVRWNGKTMFVKEKLGEPLRWTRPRLVFVNSMSDLFHETLSFESIAAVFGVMAASPRHIFQVLTKRADRMREWFRWVLEREGNSVQTCVLAARDHGCDIALPLRGAHPLYWPLTNVWMGVSVEDQDAADERIPRLLDTPAAVRWVSYEPALGPVDFGDYIIPRGGPNAVVNPGSVPPERIGLAGVDWIVVGGESGAGARPFDLEWARRVIAQTRGTSCAAFVKQLGARPMGEWGGGRLPQPSIQLGRGTEWVLRSPKGADPDEWAPELRVREWPHAMVGGAS